MATVRKPELPDASCSNFTERLELFNKDLHHTQLVHEADCKQITKRVDGNAGWVFTLEGPPQLAALGHVVPYSDRLVGSARDDKWLPHTSVKTENLARVKGCKYIVHSRLLLHDVRGAHRQLQELRRAGGHSQRLLRRAYCQRSHGASSWAAGPASLPRGTVQLDLFGLAEHLLVLSFVVDPHNASLAAGNKAHSEGGHTKQ
mmetsp:Transcript_31044/g.81580  ORF Transcript_31044/g.81580 Transcript_31044/m.81580 type:complete len:202 (+) Transcript_31044:2778-3383(+)